MLPRIFCLLLLAALLGPPAAVAAPAPQAAGAVIDAEAIQGYLAAFVHSRRARLPKAQIRCQTSNLPEPFTLPPGKLAVEVVPATPRLLHSRRFTLIFRVDGEVVKNLAVRGEIEALAKVPVAASDLRRGTLLSEEDLNFATMDLAELRDPCLDATELVGKKLRRSLRTGQPLTARDAVRPPLVKRGETVTISLHSGALLITARGEARENGAEGDTIKVRNVGSHKDVLCRVAAAGQVEVEL